MRRSPWTIAKDGARRVLGFAIILLVWEAGVRAGLVNRSIMPAPSAVFQALLELASTGQLFVDLAASIKAYKQAVYFMARNHDLVNKWHQEAARLPETETIAIAAAYDPNWKASRWEDVNVAITPSDLATLKATASFAFDQKLTKTLADHDRAVNHDLLKRAEAEMTGKPFDPKTVKVVKP